MKYLKYILPLVFIVDFSNAQDKKTEQNETTNVESIVESSRFEFAAESASPMSGRTINLSTGYTFTVLPDSIISYLPYYGRAFQAPMDPEDAGIKFTSTDFTYAIKDKRKGGWNITVKPKDVKNSLQISLSVSANGRASLHIISSNRQAISFNGFIKKEG